jgi:hypothetical protein
MPDNLAAATAHLQDLQRSFLRQLASWNLFWALEN